MTVARPSALAYLFHFYTLPPDRNDLFINSDNEPVPGQYTYKREPIEARRTEEFAKLSAAEKKHVLDNMPLTDPGQTRFDRQ